MATLDTYRRGTTNPFGAKGPFYDALGHRGADFAAAGGSPVPSWVAGVVEYSLERTAELGGIVGIRANTGGFFVGFAHLVDPVRIGTVLRVGDAVGTASSGGATAGSLWAGAHIHTTATRTSSSNAARGVRPLIDPVPLINQSLASPAGGGVPLEEDILAGLTNEEQRQLHTWLQQIVTGWLPDTQREVVTARQGVQDVQRRLSANGAGYDWLQAINHKVDDIGHQVGTLPEQVDRQLADDFAALTETVQGQITPGADVSGILEALSALPAATVAAIKEAL